jgi:hypothetical protein
MVFEAGDIVLLKLLNNLRKFFGAVTAVTLPTPMVFCGKSRSTLS